ncbi:DUF6525 family protein [Cognatishimia sp. MH4019]|uniref:DUF6525 family protein n=1 Tax=Cognatishimia sp. MH4019 TaxID=2854030 RepID=UPI001CD2DE9C
MPRNRGKTSLKCKRRTANPMREYDHLPAELRAWLSQAVLPWRAGSVKRSFDKALAKTGDPAKALQELDHLQARLIAKDAPSVWGQAHPSGSAH